MAEMLPPFSGSSSKLMVAAQRWGRDRNRSAKKGERVVGRLFSKLVFQWDYIKFHGIPFYCKIQVFRGKFI